MACDSLMIGYDDAKQACKFINAWGARWGLNGYDRIAYSLVDNDHAGIYGYTMTDLAETDSVNMTNRVVSGDFTGDGKTDIAGFHHGLSAGLQDMTVRVLAERPYST